MRGTNKFFMQMLVGGGVLLAFGIGITAATKRICYFHETGTGLAQEIFEMESVLTSEELWEERAKWLHEKTPRFESEVEASRHLAESLTAAAEKYQLTVESHQVVVPKDQEAEPRWSAESSSFFDRATISMFVVGTERSIIEWVHSVQSPEKFRGVDRMALEASEEGLICEVEVSQWYLDWMRSVVK